MIQHPNLNKENDLLRQMINTFEEYKNGVNDYTMKTLGEYACNIAEYVADSFQIMLKEKYLAIWKLTHNEIIQKVITDCTKTQYERAHKYLCDFIELHEIIQSIVVRNNLQQNLLSVTKDKEYKLLEKEMNGHAVLYPAGNNRQVLETGCIAYFVFELKDRKGKIGTVSVGISLDMFRNAVERAEERIPSFCAMYLVSGRDNVLYPALHRKKYITQNLNDLLENEKGYHVSDVEKGHVCGFAKIEKFPFPVIWPISILCELKVTSKETENN